MVKLIPSFMKVGMGEWGWEVGEISSYASKAFKFQLISIFKNKNMLIPHIFSIVFISPSWKLHGCFPTQKMTTSQQPFDSCNFWESQSMEIQTCEIALVGEAINAILCRFRLTQTTIVVKRVNIIQRNALTCSQSYLKLFLDTLHFVYISSSQGAK